MYNILFAQSLDDDVIRWNTFTRAATEQLFLNQFIVKICYRHMSIQ
jgi:hypothetical protein